MATPNNQEYIDAYFRGETPDSFPNAEDAEKLLKASLNLMPAHQQQIVKSKVELSKRGNSRGFNLDIRNVYEIKNMPLEKSFKKIDEDRDNTDYYYHGTDYNACQKIIGVSGQFKVTKNPKAGRMLGNGVYLAKSASKSAQYVGDFFGRGQSDGVLFLCKASLGKMKEVTQRNPSANTTLLKQKDIDSLGIFSSSSTIVDDEWAVKDEKAVLPKLWMDVNRI